MLRVALIIAVLASIAGLCLSLLVTKPAVEKLYADLQQTQAGLAAEKTAHAKAETEAKKAKELAEAKSKELSETKQELETAQSEATMQHGRADKLQTELTKTAKDKNEAQQRLGQWEALGVAPDQIIKLKVDLKSTQEAKAAVEGENKTLSHKIDNLQARLDRYEGDGDRVVDMPGLHGSVAAVDTKWNFILLDAGANQGAKEHGIVMVRHGDKLVAKAKIVRVEQDRSYANLLPDWTQGNSGVAVGDIFVY